jgi:lysozyme
MTRAALFDTIRPFAPGKTFTPDQIRTIDGLADAFGLPKAVASPAAQPAGMTITERVALELISHEAIVQEAYKDSVGIWTWSVGVTNASGHPVDGYKDKPQPISKCLEVYVWLLEKKYAPAVRTAFSGTPLTEAQFAAALSFHYNTGAIGRASWVTAFKQGDIAKARTAFMQWKNPPEILKRRQAERDLFFDGRWSNDGKASVIPVRKPSYQPDFAKAKRLDITADLREALKQV